MFKKKIGINNNGDKNKITKKILLIGLPIIVVIIAITLISTGGLSKLMGNSVTGTYTIKYISNGGIGSMSDQIMDLSSEQIIKKNEFQPPWPDAKFLGWIIYNHSEKQGLHYLYDKDNYGHFTYTTISGYQYKLSDDLDAVLLKDGGSLSEILSEIKKDGLKNFINSNDEIYLIAVWDSPMNISFDANDGTGQMNSINTTTAATGMYIPYCKYEKKGSRCIGWKIYFSDDHSWYCTWNDEKKCKNASDASLQIPSGYSSPTIYNLNKSYGRNIKLIAEYELNTTPLIIKFDSNGGKGEMHDQQVGMETVIDETLEKYPVNVYKPVLINKNEFIKEGYEFIGWRATLTYDNDSRYESYCFTDGGARRFYYTCRNNYAFLKDESELYGIKYDDRRQPIVTLIAQWEPVQSNVEKNSEQLNNNKFTVKYNAGGGTGSMPDQIMTYGVSTPMNPNKFTRSGYEFTGWHAKRDDGTWYCYTKSAKKKKDWVTSEDTCKKYGYYLYSDKEELSNDAPSNHYVTMYAQWKSNQFTLKFDAGGGTGSMSNQNITYGVSTAISANRFTRSGYKFTGWHAKRDDGKWYCYTNPAKTSTGWASQSTCGSFGYYLYKDKLKVKDTANPGGYTTMYAQWVENMFRVTYNANGGNGSMSDQRITYGTPTALNTNNFTKSGYAFTGWHAKRSNNTWFCYTNPAETSTGWAKQSTCESFGYYLYKDKLKVKDTALPGDYVVMYAQWKTNQFTVRYYPVGGIGSMDDQNITYGVSTALKANSFKKNGYTFIGWNAQRGDGTWYCYTNPAKTSKDWVNQPTCSSFGYYLYSDKQTVSRTVQAGGIVRMVAQWKTNQFTVRFNANGGTGSMNDQKVTYGVSTKLNANKFTRSGYTFIGWTATRADGNGYCYTNPGKTSTGWVNQSTCGSFGRYVYKNGQSVSKTVPAGGIVTMYAQWRRN